MKKAATLLLLFLITSFVSAQVVTSEPEFATQYDSIVVFFDATEGDQGLMGYTGNDVYAHTGVITNYSTSPSDWKHVIANWGTNIPKALLTRIAPDLYKLVIGYPREYYNMSDPNENILQLAFVFRNANASRTGRDVGGDDIFLDLYEPGITTVIIEPHVDLSLGDPKRSPVFAGMDDTVYVSATAATVGTAISSLKILVNNTVVNEVQNNLIDYNIMTSQYDVGYQTVSVVSEDTLANSDTASFYIMINPPVTDEVRPSGTSDGINYVGGSSVVLSLFAPYKEFVYVIGDFNDWKVDTLYYMKKDEVSPDSAHYWLQLDGLTPGQEYAFQYLVDGEIRIADPYTDKILDPWNDRYIPSSIYPNLKPYPDGKTNEPVAVLQTDQTPFTWVYSDTFTRPEKKDLVIYEMLLRDFLQKHDFETLADTLGYFRRLGINAIELMPFNEFEGNSSWGYNPSFYFAPDKYYGPKDDLKRFIDECHRMGIAVIQDMVLNHSYGQSPLVRLYWDNQNNRPSAQNPWYNVVSPNPVYSWGYDFDHTSAATKAFVDRVNRYWVTEYKVDGYRFDFTKGFTNTPGDGSGYDQSRINILERMANQIWAIDTTIFVILEHFADNSEEKVLAEYSHGMMLWGNLNYNYNEATMGYHDNGKSDFSWGYYGTRNWNQPHLVTYMESHDEERLMFKNENFGNSSGSYDVKDTTTALQRMQMAAAFFLTYPGPKMIWQFGELGYDISIDFNGRVGEKPILWNYLDDPRRERLFKTFATLLDIRSEYDVFTSPQTSVDLWLNDPAGRKRIRLMHPDMNVTIVGNFGVVTQSVDPNFLYPGVWYDYFSGDSLTVPGGGMSVTLYPGQFHIYTDQKLPTPEPGLLTDIPKKESQTPFSYQLRQNYPNPFNPETNIIFEIPGSERVKIVIFNILGQKVATLADRRFSAGRHRLIWQGRNDAGQPLASGVYFLRMEAGDFVHNRRMVLMK